ncbi:MAG: hypothetical protein LBR22_07065 [Desulfovibrio sp.]|nr:hypothetical protein [Desulfovibrio sp.]
MNRICVILGVIAALTIALLLADREKGRAIAALDADLQRLGLSLHVREYLGDDCFLVAPEGGGPKRVVYAAKGVLALDGVRDRRTGEDVLRRATLRAMGHEPAKPVAMHRNGDAGRIGIGARPGPAPVPLTEEEFRIAASAPAVTVSSETASSRDPLVVFTWGRCPTCTSVRNAIEAKRDALRFPVRFMPVAGSEDLDRAAMAYLAQAGGSSAPGNGSSPQGDQARKNGDALKDPGRDPIAQADVIARLNAATDILGRRTGAVRVPAFAWRGKDGTCRIGNLDKAGLESVVAFLNGRVDGDKNAMESKDGIIPPTASKRE